MRVIFPWPLSQLSPNARVHHMELARVKKAAKIEACWLAKNAQADRFRKASGIVVSLEFCPPDKRRRDIDNMLASCKALLNGLSAAMGVDDSEWRIVLSRGAPVKGGQVVVTVSAAYSAEGNDYAALHRQIVGEVE